MKEKKKIIIVNNNLNTGGTTSALVNLLNEIKEIYDVTILIFNAGEEHNVSLPGEVTLIKANSYLRLLGITQDQTSEEGLHLYLLRGILALWTKFINNFLPFKILFSTQKKIKGYDVAISYLQGSLKNQFYGGCNEYVLSKVEADKKIGFVHCDYLKYGGNTGINKYYYRKFDSIAAVSNGCSSNFKKAIPELSSKVFSVRNFHNFNDIKRRGMENPVQYNEEFFNMVTVARLSSEKGIIRTIDAIKKLKNNNYKIQWHIVGDGPQRSEIEQYIKERSLENNIFLYGNKNNPYRYITNADIFLLPSFHEAAPMVIGEAKCLGTPVITTNTISAKEMIIEGKEGFISENNENALYDNLLKILNNPKLIENCREYLNSQNYSNEEALEQFLSIVES